MQLRAATPDDALEVARVHVRAWQVGYRDLMPADYLASLRPEDRAARYTFGDPDPDKPSTIVAIDAGAIVGFVTTGRRDELGHLMALYVDPDRWSRGIGRALIEAGRGVLAGRGFREAVLWVLAGNARAARFYAADGWRTDGTAERKQLWGIEIADHCYRRALP